jgi:hypothetical protein
MTTIMDRREFLQGAAAAAATRLRSFESGISAPAVSLLLDRSAGSPGAIALRRVRSALAKRQVACEDIQILEAARGHTILIAGIAKDSEMMAELGKKFQLDLPSSPESLLIRQLPWSNKRIFLLCGADPLGLAYALYEVADRIGWSETAASPLSEVRDVRESPAVRDRSLSIYSMQQAYFEKRLFNENYWSAYLDNLVSNRFNNFSLLFAYESSGFLAPPYAWFFDLPEFPEVTAVGFTKEQQGQYLKSLNRLIQMTHERGLKFTLGIWDHIYDGHSSYYTEGVWDHLPIVNGRRPRWPVEGLTDENLVAYTPKALKRFLELVPNIDAIQFRMHGESGLNKAGLKNFWVPIFRVMAEQNPPIRFDARAKEFPRDLIETALQMGVHLRLTTKYVAEQVGPPFHAMHVQRFDQFQTRFSYFDMLRYPQKYKVQWRHWTSGTTRILLWGDLEYVRRFAETTHLYDGDGYEVAEPLATKMASKPHDMPPIELLNPQARYYDEEFQRYWPFFFAFGRLGYNPDTPPETWQKQFELHYGRSAAPYVERAITAASGILPRIIGYSLPLSKFPTTRGWPERQRWDDLPDYAAAEPSDTQLFESFHEEAQALLSDATTVKIRPQRTSEWFAERAKIVRANVQEAEHQAGPQPSKEFVSTVVDLKILACLADYHSLRIHAGIHYALFQQSKELSAMDDALAWERKALLAWEQLVHSTGDVYADDLAMGLRETAKSNRPGADLSGHWRDELPKLRLGIEKLERERDQFRPECRQVVGKFAFDKGSVEAGYLLLPRTRDFSLELANGVYELEFLVRDYPAHPRDWGPMWIEANGADRTDTFVAKSGNPVHRTLLTDVRDGKLGVMMANQSTGEWNISTMIVTRVQPTIAHVPVRKVIPGEDVVLRATAGAVGEIRYVKTYWKGSSGRFTVREMKRRGPFQYELILPAADCGHGGSYYLIAADEKGRTTTWPSAGRDQPFVMGVKGRDEPCSLAHDPVRSMRPGIAVHILASVKAGSGLEWVRLRYRSVNQYQDYFALEMISTGKPDQYEAEIPGEHILPTWDFMYFFEVMDKQGNGHIFPDAEKETPYVIVALDRRSA